MATRDLTIRFVEMRSRAGKRAAPRDVDNFSDSGLLEKKNRKPSVPDGAVTEAPENGLLQDASGPSSWAMTRQQLPPVWIDKVDRVEEIVREVQRRMRDLSALHIRRLMVSFDESEAEKERDIDRLTAEITQLFRQAEKQLKLVMSGGQGPGQPELTDAELTVRNNIQRATARRLQALSAAFRNSQKEYLRRLKAQKTGGDGFDFLTEKEDARGGQAVGMLDPGFNQQQLAILEDTEAVVQERDAEINNIVKSIEELSTIFKELAVLVIDQGTILDRIDFNMEQVVEHTKEGVAQLQRAEAHQKSALPTKCIALLLFLIAVMVLVLILKHTTFNK